jgi:hypothetical protein
VQEAVRVFSPGGRRVQFVQTGSDVPKKERRS